MHPNFWKYFAISSVIVTCIVVIIGTWMFWLSRTPQSNTHAPDTINTVTEQDSDKENPKPVVPEKDRLTILAAGDIMLDRTMLLLAQKYNDFGYSFRMISSTLKQADIRIANLEGPITTNKSISNGEGGARFNFTFSPKVTTTLKENFDIVSLANNHTTNFGFEGLEQTRDFLDNAGLEWFGDPNNRKEEKLSIIVEKNGIKIGVVGYHQLVEEGFENVIAEVQKIRPEVDVIIAYPHWGIEYVTNTPSVLQKKEAHELIDAGVDIIIGAHPHVIEPVELYKDKIIFYSLGNFVFDQYFSLQTMQGLLLNIALEKDTENVNARINLVPIHINKQSQPFVAETEEREQILGALSQVSIGDEELKQAVKVGKIEIVFPLAQMK